jgi:hypothetical protein
MRLYTFCNFYLSSIQQGVQTAHVVSEMFSKYYKPFGSLPLDPKFQLLRSWASDKEGKTIIILNGGNCYDLAGISNALEVEENTKYPCAPFYEDAQSLNRALTCVGVVVPEAIYESAALIRNGQAAWLTSNGAAFMLSITDLNDVESCGYLTDKAFDEFDIQLINLLNSCGLAR